MVCHLLPFAKVGQYSIIVPGYSLKCSLLLKSEVYPIFLLLYPSSTALK